MDGSSSVDLAGLDQTAEQAIPPITVYTAQVVRADESGLWVVPIGEDPTAPIGPCKGGWTANGTRVPPGALVALMLTDDGPWAIGVDNPAFVVPDEGLAPFDNPSFEDTALGAFGQLVPAGWSVFWSASSEVDEAAGPIPAGKYAWSSDDSILAVHGSRALRVTGNNTYAGVESNRWNVPPGSALEVTFYARGEGPAPVAGFALWSNVSPTYPGPFGGGSAIAGQAEYPLTGEWLRYRTIVQVPPTHNSVNLFVRAGADVGSGAISTAWIDNVDVDIVDLNPATEHQDFMRRAALVLLGGGVRQVTAGGNVSWSQSFTIAGAGMEPEEALDGRFAIAQPANGTIIPVHSSAARTTHTVAGGVIALNPDDALWYEIPIGQAATSQPGRFHIVGSSAADDYVVPPHWILIVRRASAWSSTSFAQEYRWGDGRHQDPLRSPSLNGGWTAGTIAPTFTKGADNLVTMRGRVAGGAGSAFTLPAGYRPSVQHDAYVRDGAGNPALLTVTSAGVVTTAGSNTDHSIATSFVADQP
jgi:hypothetical protein